ncbi:MFS transporter [Dactylosporangium sp. AC04546]|uniref:MFS transporter n=1 Tax=Dactylosporangium sp. AC04546 TaxID=2862460 RepID=UPI001EDED69F|nr:MFS transporter [Dactylosporangium sp. AC04546]WVK89407.1 MFS transporter [Dactylosporangium sp. AC04546]
MFEALRIADFRLLWFARSVSLLGSWLLVVAVPAHVFTLTGSVAATGLTLAAEFLPPLLLAPLAGVLADRVDRRKLMIGADVARVGAVLLLLLVRDPDDVWLVYAALTAEATGTTMFRPAAQSNTPAVVGTGPALSSANALNATTDGIVRLVAAPLGGALYAWIGFTPLVSLNAATYAVSAAALLLTTPLTRQPGHPQTAVEAAGAGGVRHLRAALRQAPTARTLLLVNTVFLGANASLSALLVPYGITVLGGPAQIGLVMSALGIGFLLGAPLTRVLVDRAPPAYLLGAALATTAAGYLLLFSATTMATALPAAVVIGTAGSTVLSATQTTLQRATPNAVLGRTTALLLTGEAAATLLGALAGPAAAHAMSPTWAAVLAATTTALTAAAATLRLPRTTAATTPATAS